MILVQLCAIQANSFGPVLVKTKLDFPIYAIF